jgi:hypothetical protein
MTEQEIKLLLEDIANRSNDAIDKLIPIRQTSWDDNKYKYGYIIKKLEVIVGACNRGLDKLSVEYFNN